MKKTKRKSRGAAKARSSRAGGSTSFSRYEIDTFLDRAESAGGLWMLQLIAHACATRISESKLPHKCTVAEVTTNLVIGCERAALRSNNPDQQPGPKETP